MDGPALVWLAPVAALAVFFAYTFNRLVARRNACTNARSAIDVNLTRRHDLIPNLVKAVQGYMQHEKATLRELTEARQVAIDKLGVHGSATAEKRVGQSLELLLARVERYPELKADRLFGQLMRNLTEAEEQISASRRAFNGQVLRLNNLVQQFPTLIVARMTGFSSLTPYSAAAEARHSSLVDLGPARGA